MNKRKIKLAVIGDFDPSSATHLATNGAILHSAEQAGLSADHDWIATDAIHEHFNDIVQTYSSFWIAPGSPYKSMSGALDMIRYARTHRRPVLGTCGGFQHMVIEYARNVLHIDDAQHAEYDPYASRLVVNPLSCNLKGDPLEIMLTDDTSLAARIYGTGKITEQYYCNFGLNPDYQEELHRSGFRIVGTDTTLEARILELQGPPFFIATLFVPQDRSRPGSPNRLITAFLEAAAVAYEAAPVA